MKITQKLKPLLPGATIGVIAPGSSSDPALFNAGIAALEQRGFKTRCPLDPCSRYRDKNCGFGSADADERARAFMELIEDDTVQAIVGVRGGYGSIEILPLLDWKKIAAARKAVVGFSDMTVLLLAIAARSGLPAIHGPTVATQLADPQDAESADWLFAMLDGSTTSISMQMEVLRAGTGSGALLGGNLTMLLSLLGTPWDMTYDNCVLFVEEVGEASYRVHRAFTQLRMAGKLDKLAGLVIGRITGPAGNDCVPMERVVREEILNICGDTSFPILLTDTIGHAGVNLSLPIACEVTCDEQGTIEIASPVDAKG